MDEEKSVTTKVVTVLLIFLVASVLVALSFLFISGLKTTVVDTESKSSETQNELYLTPFSIDKTPVTSYDLYYYNNTWLNFDGVDDWVNGTTNLSYNFNTSDDFTIRACFKTSASYSSAIGNIINRRGGSNYYCLQFLTTNNLNFGISEGITQTNVANTSSSPFLRDGNWHCAYGVWDATNNISKLYIDGVYFNYGNIASKSPLLNTGTLGIGQQGGDNQRWFNGSIDEVKIFNRSLTTKEILLDYNSSKYAQKKYITIPIIMYHNISTVSQLNSYDINITDFYNQMNYLYLAGFHTITDLEYYNWTINGGFVMPDNPIILTFDDGFISALTYAAPNMSAFGFKGVVGLIVNKINTTGYLSWDNVTTLVNTYNWSLASHSLTHCSLSIGCNTTQKFSDEFNVSRNYIIGNTSITPITFIFPGSNWNQNALDNCSLVYGYKLCSTNYTTPNPPIFNYEVNLTNKPLTRVAIYNSTSLNQFRYFLNFSVLTNQKKILDYEFNENSGTTAYDSSGNGNNGTIIGATWQNDGVLNKIPTSKYTINLNSGLTSLSNDYLYEYLTVSYNTVVDKTSLNALTSIENSGSTAVNFLPLVFLVTIFGAILFLVLKFLSPYIELGQNINNF